MRTRLQRLYRFEAAHFLPKVPPGHKCARMHGHSYEIRIAIEGDVDEERGWVMDFATIDEHAMPIIKQLDHQVLNEIDGLANPTSELLARWLWQRFSVSFPLVEVVVSETNRPAASIAGDRLRGDAREPDRLVARRRVRVSSADERDDGWRRDRN